MHLSKARARSATLIAGLLWFGACSNDVSDLERFERMIAGDWDNVRQAGEDARLELDDAHRHPRRAMTYIPIENANLEGRLFAILNYSEHGFEGPVQRLSLHRFRWSETHDSIVHEFLFLLESHEWGDANTDFSYLARLGESDVRINAQCAMYWRWQGDHFRGATKKGSCVTSSFTAEPILVEGHGELWPNRLVRHDANFSLEGEPLPTPGGASPEIFDRVSRTTYKPEGLLEDIEAVRAVLPDQQ